MRVESISSSANAKFKTWLELLNSRGIRDNGLCIVSGEKIVNEILEKHSQLVSCVLTLTDFAEKIVVARQTQGEHSLYHKAPALFALTRELFRELDVFGTNSPLLIVKTPSLHNEDSSFLKTQNAVEGLELVIPFSDPGNVGAVIRTAVAFGVAKIILTEEAASPFLPKSLRASVGLSLFAPITKGPKLKDFAQANVSSVDQKTFVLNMNGKNLGEFTWPKNVRLIIGEEGLGLPSSLDSIQRISIPMNSQVESLNAAIATSLALFDYAKQFS